MEKKILYITHDNDAYFEVTTTTTAVETLLFKKILIVKFGFLNLKKVLWKIHTITQQFFGVEIHQKILTQFTTDQILAYQQKFIQKMIKLNFLP